jgi:glucosamine--fructose-6-phosphate aminotransferase (isomerizing)
LEALYTVPDILDRTLPVAEDQVRMLLPSFQSQKMTLVAGTGSNYGVALEAAMKIGETAYIPTHCDDTGNVLHSPMGILGKEWLSIMLVTKRDLELSKIALGLIGQFGPQRLSIIEPGLDLSDLGEQVLTLTEAIDPFLAALVYLLPIQLITYYWAVARGLNPDTPASMHATLAAVLAPGRKEPELR